MCSTQWKGHHKFEKIEKKKRKKMKDELQKFFPLGFLCKLATASCMQWGESQLNLQSFIFLLACYVVEPVLERCLLSVRAAFTVAVFSFVFCELGRLPYPPETIRLYLCSGCCCWGLSSKCVKNLASNHNTYTGA